MPTFPGGVLETLHLRVVRDLAASRSYYVDVLGASVVRQMGEDLVFLELAGIKIVLSVEGGPTADKPAVSFLPPPDPDVVHAELIIRVRDAEEVYRTLSARGATFLTPRWKNPGKRAVSSVIPTATSSKSHSPLPSVMAKAYLASLITRQQQADPTMSHHRHMDAGPDRLDSVRSAPRWSRAFRESAGGNRRRGCCWATGDAPASGASGWKRMVRINPVPASTVMLACKDEADAGTRGWLIVQRDQLLSTVSNEPNGVPNCCREAISWPGDTRLRACGRRAAHLRW